MRKPGNKATRLSVTLCAHCLLGLEEKLHMGVNAAKEIKTSAKLSASPILRGKEKCSPSKGLR